jgi:hypothetical protein
LTLDSQLWELCSLSWRVLALKNSIFLTYVPWIHSKWNMCCWIQCLQAPYKIQI